jgi:hypothetical protein
VGGDDARSYNGDTVAVATHLQWPEVKVRAAIHYAEAFSEEIDQALAENDATNLQAIQRMLPQAEEFIAPSL